LNEIFFFTILSLFCSFSSLFSLSYTVLTNPNDVILSCLPSVCQYDPLLAEISDVIEEWGSRVLLGYHTQHHISQSFISDVEKITSLLLFRRQLLTSGPVRTLGNEDVASVRKRAMEMLHSCRSLLSVVPIGLPTERGPSQVRPSWLCGEHLRSGDAVAVMCAEAEGSRTALHLVEEMAADYAEKCLHQTQTILDDWRKIALQKPTDEASSFSSSSSSLVDLASDVGLSHSQSAGVDLPSSPSNHTDDSSPSSPPFSPLVSSPPIPDDVISSPGVSEQKDAKTAEPKIANRPPGSEEASPSAKISTDVDRSSTSPLRPEETPLRFS
jgi:hypothetical protein